MLVGLLAVLLNPTSWLFLLVVATPLLGDANRSGGRQTALAAALALQLGAASGDLLIVLVGGVAFRRWVRVRLWMRRCLALSLIALAVSLVVSALR